MNRSEWNADRTAELGIFEAQGREFAALGATVTPEHIVCYPDDKGSVNAWDGTNLGRYVVLSSRPAVFFGHQSWQGERYYYMRAYVNGRTYSIRGFGPGCVATGKVVKS